MRSAKKLKTFAIKSVYAINQEGNSQIQMYQRSSGCVYGSVQVIVPKGSADHHKYEGPKTVPFIRTGHHTWSMELTINREITARNGKASIEILLSHYQLC